MLISSTPIFATSDVVGTIRHYKEVLGFETSWTWGDPPTFGSVSWGGTTIMFGLQPELAAKVSGHAHWIKVEDVDAVYEILQSRGAKIVSRPVDQEWGAREFVAEDPNGYRLRFAGPPRSEARPSEPFPEEVQVVDRMPTHEEYALVTAATFGHDSNEDRTELLARSWSGVVALGPEEQPIGVLRIVWDAPGWYSIWDVGVVPEWQGRHIGERMMRQALDQVRAVSPGAFVFLFTFKHEFYARFGFNKETVSMVRV